MKNIQFLQIDFNLITDTKITSNEFRIYAYLLSLYNDNKKCSYPSLETIANKLNISLTTVKKSIKRLAELGYMKIEKKKADRGFFNTYTSFKNMIKKKINKKSSKKAKANKVTPVDLKEIELISNETGLEKEKAEQLLKIAEPKKILEVYEYAKSRAKNLYSFMFKAIKDNWNIQSVVSQVYENIEAGRGNYISNNKKRFTKKFSEEEIRKAEELENDLLGWY